MVRYFIIAVSILALLANAGSGMGYSLARSLPDASGTPLNTSGRSPDSSTIEDYYQSLFRPDLASLPGHDPRSGLSSGLQLNHQALVWPRSLSCTPQTGPAEVLNEILSRTRRDQKARLHWPEMFLRTVSLLI